MYVLWCPTGTNRDKYGFILKYYCSYFKVVLPGAIEVQCFYLCLYHILMKCKGVMLFSYNLYKVLCVSNFLVFLIHIKKWPFLCSNLSTICPLYSHMFNQLFLSWQSCLRKIKEPFKSRVLARHCGTHL